MTVRKARLSDVEAIGRIVNGFAGQGEMLPRTPQQIWENIRDFWAAEDEAGRLIGCAALHIDWEDLAEVKSLAVSDAAQGRGVGRALVEHCLADAEALGLARVYALTYRPGFFEKLGFVRIDKAHLPRKVWNECVYCPKFPDCGEIAVIRYLRGAPPEGTIPDTSRELASIGAGPPPLFDLRNLIRILPTEGPRPHEREPEPAA